MISLRKPPAHCCSLCRFMSSDVGCSDAEAHSDSDSDGHWVPRAPPKKQVSSKAKEPNKKRDSGGKPAGGDSKEKGKQPSPQSKQSPSQGGTTKR